MLEGRSVYRVLLVKPEGKRIHGRHKHRWEVNMMDLEEVGWGTCTGLSGSVYGRVAGTCKCSNELLVSIKSGNFQTS
jgi:hypothetical protein